MTNIVFTRRMAGVIYRNWKENKLNIADQDIKFMYDFADACENAYSKMTFYQNQNSLYIDSFNEAIEAIFANDFEKAQKELDRIKEYNDFKRALYA